MRFCFKRYLITIKLKNFRFSLKRNLRPKKFHFLPNVQFSRGLSLTFPPGPFQKTVKHFFAILKFLLYCDHGRSKSQMVLINCLFQKHLRVAFSYDVISQPLLQILKKELQKLSFYKLQSNFPNKNS